MSSRISVLLFILLLAASFGCSASTTKDAITPDPQESAIGHLPLAISQTPLANSQLWGFWQFSWNGSTFDIVPIRSAEDHFNVVSLLQPPGWPHSVVVQNVKFDKSVVDLDITLKHPISDPKFNGHDVKGIFFGTGFNAEEIPIQLLSTPAQTNSFGLDIPGGLAMSTSTAKLLNADGYTCWWNAPEYKNGPNKLLKCLPGEIGAEDLNDFSATANPYKVFADSIGSGNASFSGITSGNSLLFSAGQSRTRHYQIDFVEYPKYEFQYAVDASWDPDEESPIPQDEPIITSVNIDDSNLYEHSGSLHVTVEAYDHQSDALTVEVIAPDIYPGRCTIASGSGDVPNLLGAEAGEIPVWIVVTDSSENWCFWKDSATVNPDLPSWETTWSDKIPVPPYDADKNQNTPLGIFDTGETLHIFVAENGTGGDNTGSLFYYSYDGTMMTGPTQITPLPSSKRLTLCDLCFDGGNILLVFHDDDGASYYVEIDPTSPAIPFSQGTVDPSSSGRSRIESSGSAIYSCWGSTSPLRIQATQWPPTSPQDIFYIAGLIPKYPVVGIISGTPVFCTTFIKEQWGYQSVLWKVGLSVPGNNESPIFQGIDLDEFISDELSLAIGNNYRVISIGRAYTEWQGGDIPPPDEATPFSEGNIRYCLYDTLDNGMIFYHNNTGTSIYLGYLLSATTYPYTMGEIVNDMFSTPIYHVAISGGNELALLYLANDMGIYLTTSIP